MIRTSKRVLHDVGEISRVEGVPIIHRTAGTAISPRAAAFAIDLRALPEIAQVAIHADANFLEHPAAAGDRHHLGPQSRIGFGEGPLDLDRHGPRPCRHCRKAIWNPDALAGVA